MRQSGWFVLHLASALCSSIKPRGIALLFPEKIGIFLPSLWHRPCDGEDDVSQHSNLTPGRISMTKTVASLTAVAVLYAFTSALAQMPESVPAPTAPPEVPAPQATAPATAPAPSMEMPKGDRDKEKRGEMRREHRERGKSGEHRKDGEHKRRGKHRDKHEDGDKHSERGKHKDRERQGDKDKHEDDDKHEKN
jgi:hypothetical protein